MGDVCVKGSKRYYEWANLHKHDKLGEAKERGKHEEAVNGGTRDVVGNVSHGDGPGEVVIAFVCARLFSLVRKIEVGGGG